MTAPRSAMAAVALELIEFHGGDWDCPANFVSVRWDGDKATLGGYWTAIALDVPPERYRDDGSVREQFWPPLKPVGAPGAVLRSLALETLR